MSSSPLRIDTPQGEAFFRQRCTLEEREFILQFKWNSRGGAWYMDILAADQDETPLRQGLKLVVDWPLNMYVPALEDLPGGVFYILGSGRPTLDSLGTDHVLYYVTPGD